MSTTVELPNGQTAELLGSEDLTNRQVKELRRIARRVGVVSNKLRELGLDELTETPDESKLSEDAKKKLEQDRSQKTMTILSSLTDTEDDDLDLFQRHCVVMRLKSWTLDRELPKNVAEVDDLPRPVYTVLTTAAVDLDLNENFDKDSGVADPKADTASSVD